MKGAPSGVPFAMPYTGSMHEPVTRALVLARYPQGEADLRVSLFAEELGRLHATVVSGRKITSRLGPHLLEGSVVSVRLIEQRDIRVGDALTIKESVRDLGECLLLDRLLPEHVSEPEVWRIATASRMDWSAALVALGWDPRHASCTACGRAAAAFIVRNQEFLCAEHAPHAPPPGEVVPLRHGRS